MENQVTVKENIYETLSKLEVCKLEQKDYKVITKRPDGSRRVQTINKLPSRTLQSAAIGTNPNDIVRRYGYRNLPQPQQVFQDFSQLPDLMEARNVILKAEKSFLDVVFVR